MLKVVLSFILGGYAIAVMTDSGINKYSFSDTVELCVPKEAVYDNSLVNEDEAKVGRLLIKMGDFPFKVNYASENNPISENSIFLKISDAHLRSASLKKRFDRVLNKIESSEILYDENTGLFRVAPEDQSALSSEHYLTRDIRNDGFEAHPNNFEAWYAGLCVEGIGREDRCSTFLFHNGLYVEYHIVLSVMKNWKDIEAIIKNRLSSMSCTD